MPARGRIKIDAALCKGCRYCVEDCPQGALKLSVSVNEKGYCTARVADASACTGCGICALVCPEAAITVWKTTNDK